MPYITVKPLKTFEYGGDIRSPEAGAFPIDKTHQAELKALGFIDDEGGVESETLPEPVTPETKLKKNRPLKGEPDAPADAG